MPQLDPTWYASQLFWLLITFTVLYVLMSQLLLPPLMRVLQQRADQMQGDIESAQHFKTQAEEARIMYEKALADSRSRAQLLMSESALQAKSDAARAAAEMDAQVLRKIAEADRAIAATKTDLMNKLTPVASELAGMIVEKLVRQKPASQKVDELVSELARAKNLNS